MTNEQVGFRYHDAQTGAVIPGQDDEDEDFGSVNEEEVAGLLQTLLEEADLDEVPLPAHVDMISVRTFAEAGVLTRNEGLVVQVGDAEFQITIVRSR